MRDEMFADAHARHARAKRATRKSYVKKTHAR